MNRPARPVPQDPRENESHFGAAFERALARQVDRNPHGRIALPNGRIVRTRELARVLQALKAARMEGRR
jgi:hypothetical protein